MTKNDRIERARLGGRARGWEERKAALERYHLNPHHCRNCGKMIEVGDRRVADVIKKQFCGYSCSTQYRIRTGSLTAFQPAA
jgi:hypothetical protein